MIRYLRLYKYFVEMSFGKATAYRFDFWCRILMDLAYYAISIAFFKILFLKTSNIGGWTEAQVFVFVGAHVLLDAMQMTFFSGNIWGIPGIINSGELDHYLVKPVSTLFILSLKDFAVNSCLNLFVAGGFLAWALHKYPDPFTFGQLCMFLFLLLNGLFLYYCMRLIFALPVFWTNAPYAFERVFLSLLPFMERPDGLFRGPVRVLIMTVLPFALMTSVPARIFFEGLTLDRALHIGCVTVSFFFIIQFIWRSGLKIYGSASS